MTLRDRIYDIVQYIMDGDVYGSEDAATDDILAAFREAVLSDEAMRAATRQVAYLDRAGGPDPNSYERCEARDYAGMTILAALETVMGETS